MAIFTKTAGASVTGTTADDVILVANTAAMAGGTVDGAAGTDELRFTSTAGETLVLGSNLANVERVVVGTGTGTTAITTGTAANGVNASAVGYGLTITGNAGNNAITGHRLRRPDRRWRRQRHHDGRCRRRHLHRQQRRPTS